jgi:TonB family protein
MYQTVDDQDVPETAPAQGGKRLLSSVFNFWGLAAVILFLAAMLMIFAARDPSPNLDSAVKAERASYRAAISERKISLRRARLRDFETTYSQSEFLPAVRAQRFVLDSYESRAWAALSDVIEYNTNASRADKLAAILQYEKVWGSDYLGGRGSALSQMKSGLEAAPEPLPNRELAPGKSAIPDNVPDRVMAGGPRRVITAPPPPPPSRPVVRPSAPRVTNVEPVRIRKNVRPRYPRKARRRGIGARVELSLSVDDKGEVRMAELVSVEAERYAKDFVKAAERAAMRTRYFPQISNGRPVPVSGVRKRYVFRVEN